ncbi:MAG: hypothetical protein Alpg2KO_26360 [Alphaproteobacteria bacterium]
MNKLLCAVTKPRPADSLAALTLREARPDDIENLLTCFGPDSVWRRDADFWSGVLAMQNRWLLVAELDGRIVGHGSLLTLADRTELHDLAVAPDARGLGLGRALATELEAEARRRGLQHLHLKVGLYADYGPAQRLYISLGYQMDGRGLLQGDDQVKPGQTVLVDDELLLGMVKSL